MPCAACVWVGPPIRCPSSVRSSAHRAVPLHRHSPSSHRVSRGWLSRGHWMTLGGCGPRAWCGTCSQGRGCTSPSASVPSSGSSRRRPWTRPSTCKTARSTASREASTAWILARSTPGSSACRWATPTSTATSPEPSCSGSPSAAGSAHPSVPAPSPAVRAICTPTARGLSTMSASIAPERPSTGRGETASGSMSMRRGCAVSATFCAIVHSPVSWSEALGRGRPTRWRTSPLRSRIRR